MAKDLLEKAKEARKKWEEARQTVLQKLLEFDTAESNLIAAEKEENWAIYVYHTVLEELALNIIQ